MSRVYLDKSHNFYKKFNDIHLSQNPFQNETNVLIVLRDYVERNRMLKQSKYGFECSKLFRGREKTLKNDIRFFL